MRILLVEDELLIGMDLAFILEELGHTVSGPHQTTDAALAAVPDFAPNLAFLDVNLGHGKTSLPVAEHLQSESIPFAYLTGYSTSRDPNSLTLDGVPKLSKPVSDQALKAFLNKMADGPVQMSDPEV